LLIVGKIFKSVGRQTTKKIQIFQETSFCVLRVLLLDFSNTIWQLYIDFYTIRIVFESSLQLCIFKLLILRNYGSSGKNV